MTSTRTGTTKFDALMHDVCVGHGYCGGLANGKPLHVTDFIPETGMVSADQFVDWLYLAEGDAGGIDKHRPNLRVMFIHHMGSETVPAESLAYSGLL